MQKEKVALFLVTRHINFPLSLVWQSFQPFFSPFYLFMLAYYSSRSEMIMKHSHCVCVQLQRSATNEMILV